MFSKLRTWNQFIFESESKRKVFVGIIFIMNINRTKKIAKLRDIN